MDFVQIPVFGQSVRPGLGFRFRGNYWAFFERRTKLSPWLALHRESINDTLLDELLFHGFPKSRTGQTVDCKVLTHFGLIYGPLYRDGWLVDRTERQRTAVFTGDLQVVKLPISDRPETNLLDPNSIYWVSEEKLLNHPAGSAEHERGQALVEMASILLARWREHDRLNLEFKAQSRVRELLEEGKAIGHGVGSAAVDFVQGLWDLIKVTVEFTATAVKASCRGLKKIVQSNFAEIRQMLLAAGMQAYQSAQEMIAAVQEGLRLFNLVCQDRLLRAGIFEFLDGYSESVPHLRRLHNMAGAVFVIGIEVLLALATMGGSVVAAAGRMGVRVGPFTMKSIRHLAQFAKAKGSELAQKMRADTGGAPAAPPKKAANTAANPTANSTANNSTNPSSKTEADSSTKPAGPLESTGASGPRAEKTPTQGEPISMINGEELLQLVDCSLPGLVGMNWQRTYRSSIAEQGFNAGLGAGWAHPLAQHIELNSNGCNYIDDEGRTVYFKPLNVGQQCTNTSEFLTLRRTGQHTYRLQASHGLGWAWYFEAFDQGHASLARIEDAFGNTLRIEYNGDGRPAWVHSSQASWALHYNAQGLLAHIAQVAQPLDVAGLNQWVLVQYQYNELGQLVAATDAAGHTERYAYNAKHVLVQRTLKSGYNIHFEWESYRADGTPLPNSRCARQWGDPVQGQPTYHYRFEWDLTGTGIGTRGADGMVNAAIDSRGARTEYEFNHQGLCTRQRSPEGGSTRTRYNDQGQAIEQVDELGHAQRWVYNRQGYLVAYVDKLGHTHQLELNAQGQVLRHTDPAGQSRSYTYTPEGLLASQTDATEATTRYRYNELGLPCEIINPLGQSTRLLYSAQGQIQAQTNALGHSTTYQFDTWGRLVGVSNPMGRTASYAYDLMGRCTRASNHEGLSTQYSYTELGQIAKIVDPTGRSTIYEYADRLSQPTARIDSQGFRLHYRYDSERNLVELHNENGQSCHFEYDLAERLVKERGFDGRVQTYQYNAAGHLQEKQDWGVLGGSAPGETVFLNDIPAQPVAFTRYERNAHGLLLKAIHSDGEESTFTYNALGQLVQANNAHRPLAWEVDPEGRVLAEIQDQHRIEHSYNPAGWLKQTQWQGMGGEAKGALPSSALGLNYNALGQLSEINLNGELLAQFERDTLGREVKRKLANQVQSQSLYDPQGRLVGQINRRGRNTGQVDGSGPTLSRRRYVYNQRNQLVRIDDQNHGSHFYQYDPLDRLRTVEGPNPEAFLFDPASNLLEALDGQDATDAMAAKSLPEPDSPNARRPQQAPGNRLKRQGNRRFTYDERGNRIEEIIERGPRQGQVTRYRYNAQNQLIEVNVGGVATRYAYDALGRRISKSSEHSTTTFYWNGDVLLGEVNEQVIGNADHKSPRPSRTYLFEPFSFTPLALIQNGEVFHYHTDHIGTPREISNANAEIVWSSTFKTYGALAVAHVNEVANPLRFQGQYFDEETGLHYNRHRYYDPSCGQFTTQDPIGLLGGMNAYQYAPNPLTWVDPWGLSCKEYVHRKTRIDSKVTEIEQQPLPQSVKDSFEDGEYRTVVANEDIILYRAYGGNAKASGGFATTLPVQNRIQAKQDLALLPEWKNSRTNEAVIRIPKETVLNVGKVAPQRTASGTVLQGGADQVLLPQNWPSEWIIDYYPIRP